MCVPVCMFVRTSTVLLPSRWCVVMSVTWTASNCGQVGIRSPHGCVRSTSFIFTVLCLIREVRHASELVHDLLHDGEVGDVLELQVLGDLAEVLLALDRAFDVRLQETLVLWPGLCLHEQVERVRYDVGGLLGLGHADVDVCWGVAGVVNAPFALHGGG